MIVYADVLVFLNLIINYFLLLATAKILRKTEKTWRIILASFLGALSSLYIFLPPSPIIIEIVFKASVCALMCITAFGFKGIKSFLKSVALLFGITAGFGGIMYAIWLMFSPKGMVINNSVVYFDISLLALVLFTAVGYLIFSIAFRIFSKNAPFAQSCEITIFADGKSVRVTAIVDTGNSIEDVFSMGEIIIADKKTASELFGCDSLETSALKTRYRLLPCSTVSGNDVLEGMRCDRAEVNFQNRRIVLKHPILAISKTPLPDGSDAIINPKILN